MNIKYIILLLIILNLTSSAWSEENETCVLTVKVVNLRNSEGVIQVALYDEDGTLPDERYERYVRKKNGKIVNGTSSVTFENLAKGIYAVNILHDENSNGKIDKGLFLPIEGVGFSNYKTIGITNRPEFSVAKFPVDADMEVVVDIIYM